MPRGRHGVAWCVCVTPVFSDSIYAPLLASGLLSGCAVSVGEIEIDLCCEPQRRSVVFSQLDHPIISHQPVWPHLAHNTVALPVLWPLAIECHWPSALALPRPRPKNQAKKTVLLFIIIKALKKFTFLLGLGPRPSRIV